nr:unnamed protein product [Naegleria fowleri]
MINEISIQNFNHHPNNDDDDEDNENKSSSEPGSPFHHPIFANRKMKAHARNMSSPTLFTPVFDIIIDHPKGSLIFRNFCEENLVLENWEALQTIRQFKMDVRFTIRKAMELEEVIQSGSPVGNCPGTSSNSSSSMNGKFKLTQLIGNVHHLLANNQQQHVGSSSHHCQGDMMSPITSMISSMTVSALNVGHSTAAAHHTWQTPPQIVIEKTDHALQRNRNCKALKESILIDISRIVATFINEAADKQINIDSETRKNTLQRLKMIQLQLAATQDRRFSNFSENPSTNDATMSLMPPSEYSSISNDSSSMLRSSDSCTTTNEDLASTPTSPIDENSPTRKKVYSFKKILPKLTSPKKKNADETEKKSSESEKGDQDASDVFNIDLIGSFSVKTSNALKAATLINEQQLQQYEQEFKDLIMFFDQIEVQLLLLLKDDVFPRFVRSTNWLNFLKQYPHDALECAKTEDIEDLKKMRFTKDDFQRVRLQPSDFERCERLFADSILFDLIYENYGQSSKRLKIYSSRKRGNSYNKKYAQNSPLVGVYFSNGENFIDEDSLKLGKFGVQKKLGYLDFPAEVVLSALCDIDLQSKLLPKVEKNDNSILGWTKCEDTRYYPSLITHYTLNLGKMFKKRGVYASNCAIFDHKKYRYHFLSKSIYSNSHFPNIDERGKKTIASATITYASIIPVSKSRCKLIYVMLGNMGGVVSKFSSFLFKQEVTLFDNHLQEELVKMKAYKYADLENGYNMVRNCIDYRNRFMMNSVEAQESATTCPFPKTFAEFQELFS